MQASLTLVYNLKAAEDEIARLLFSADGKTLAACDDQVITLWDTTTGCLRSTTANTDDMFFDIPFSPDNRWIAAASASDDGYARIWSTTTGELKQMVSVDDGRVLSIAFSTDSKSIATGSEIVRIWDVETGDLQHTLLGPGDHSLSFTTVYMEHEYPPEIYKLSFSPDGKTLASSCVDTDTVQLWSTEIWKLKQAIVGRVASFSPDGAHLAVHGNVNDYTTIQIYETVNWQVESTIRSKEQLHSPTFSPDSEMIATHSGRKIMLCEIKSGEPIRTFNDPKRDISALSFSLDGKILISTTEECGLRVWNIETGECEVVLENEDEVRDPWKGCRGGPPAFKTFFSDGRGKVAIALASGSIRIWDVSW